MTETSRAHAPRADRVGNPVVIADYGRETRLKIYTRTGTTAKTV